MARTTQTVSSHSFHFAGESCTSFIETGRTVLNVVSGPAKGYTDALENRLRETENTLLRLLSVVSVATLESAFDNNPGLNMADGQSESRTDKAELAAHWDQFPLSSAHDIMKWANEQENFRNLLLQAGSGLPLRLDEQISAPLTIPVYQGQTGNIGELLPTNNTTATLRTQFAQNSPNFVQNVRGGYNTAGLIVENSQDSDPGDDTFDLPQQFKEKYLW